MQVYPGHPLMIALEVMRHFPSAADAFDSPDLGSRAVLGSTAISGAGDMVHLACDLLLRYRETRNSAEAVAFAYSRWERVVGPLTGNNEKAFVPGMERARQLEAEFVAALEQWNWAPRGDAPPSAAVG
jgi:hypothetical protein